MLRGLINKVGSFQQDDSARVEVTSNLRGAFPNRLGILSVRNQSTFSVSVDPMSDGRYSGILHFSIPDPFEVRNAGRPSNVVWKYDKQQLVFDEFGPGEILMQVVLPEKYRGRKFVVLSIKTAESGDIVEKVPILSVPPLSSMSSVEPEV